MGTNDRNEEIQNLKNLAKKDKNAHQRQVYDAVRLHLEGRPGKEIAEIFNITYRTVRNYINSYDEKGIDGLILAKPPGRETKLTEEQEKKLYDCISTKIPKEVGFEPFVNWSAPLAVAWVSREFGVIFSERGMRDVFYRMNLSYTRPTYTLKKADPSKQASFATEFEGVKKS